MASQSVVAIYVCLWTTIVCHSRLLGFWLLQAVRTATIERRGSNDIQLHQHVDFRQQWWEVARDDHRPECIVSPVLRDDEGQKDAADEVEEYLNHVRLNSGGGRCIKKE